MKIPKRWNQIFFNYKIRDSLSHNKEDKPTEGDSTNNYRLSFFEIMLKIIVYFQPFDAKLLTNNQSNSKTKVIYIFLEKASADKFLKKIEYNQIGDRVATQIRKRLFTQVQFVKEWRDMVNLFN